MAVIFVSSKQNSSASDMHCYLFKPDMQFVMLYHVKLFLQPLYHSQRESTVTPVSRAKLPLNQGKSSAPGPNWCHMFPPALQLMITLDGTGQMVDGKLDATVYNDGECRQPPHQRGFAARVQMCKLLPSAIALKINLMLILYPDNNGELNVY